MKKLQMFGSSDDLLECDGLPGCDEFNVIKDGPYIASLQVHSPTQGTLRIHAIYDGCWSFAVGQSDEDDIYPNWPIKYSLAKKYNGYSMLLEIECADDAKLIPEGKLE